MMTQDAHFARFLHSDASDDAELYSEHIMHPPVAIQPRLSEYELTFKKNHEMFHDGARGPSANLFPSRTRHSKPQSDGIAVEHLEDRSEQTDFWRILSEIKEKPASDMLQSLRTQGNPNNSKQPPLSQLLNRIQDKIHILQYFHQPNIYDTLPKTQRAVETKDTKKLLLCQYVREKIALVLMCKNLSQLRNKRNNVRVNIAFMEHKSEEASGKALTEVEKHRMYLLHSLQSQLNKKILITELKYGVKHRNWVRRQKLREQESLQFDEEPEEYEGQIMEDSLGDMEQYLCPAEPQAQPLKNSTKMQQNVNIYYQSNRLAIFHQIISTITSRRLYQAFETIYHHEDEHQNQQYQQPAYAQEQMDYQEDQDNNEEQEELDRQEKINALESYIINLRKTIKLCPRTDEDLKFNYFTKWKLHFLFKMLYFIRQDPELEDSRENVHTPSKLHAGSRSNAIKHNPEELSPPPNALPTPSQASLLSNNSDLNPLKKQKHLLKEMIYFGQCRKVFSRLQQNYSVRSTKKICRMLYEKNLLEKSFAILQNQKHVRQRERAAEENAQYWGENQDETQAMTAFYFHKSSTLAKTFFALKNFYRCSRLANKVEKHLYKTFMLNLKQIKQGNEENEGKIERYLDRKNKMVLYKYFSILKAGSSASQRLTQKYNQYREKANYEKMEVCFSVLSLKWKKKLALRKRVEGMLQRKQLLRFYQRLQENLNQRQKQQAYERNVVFLMNKVNKKNCLNKFREYYVRQLEQKRVEILSQKILIGRADSQAALFLRNWRVIHTKKSSYRAIELRLIRLKQREQRGHLFETWRKRLQQKRKGSHRKGNDHNIWLKKYYNQLCTLEK